VSGATTARPKAAQLTNEYSKRGNVASRAATNARPKTDVGVGDGCVGDGCVGDGCVGDVAAALATQAKPLNPTPAASRRLFT
jgi:hypothetical protein